MHAGLTLKGDQQPHRIVRLHGERAAIWRPGQLRHEDGPGSQSVDGITVFIPAKAELPRHKARLVHSG